MTYNYIDKGKGQPIVMLHGMLGHASNWNKISSMLEDSYRTLALDLPYLGLDKKELSIGYLSDYVLRFADEMKLDKAIYMGNSLGGHIAIDLALKKLKRVESLILTGSSGLFERTYEKDVQIHPTREYLKRKIEDIFYDKRHVTDVLLDEVYSLLKNRKNIISIVRLTKAARNYNVKDLLKDITCPTLLVWGKNDTITPPKVANEFNRNIKGSRLEFIEECCHAPMMEYPDRFGEIVLDFLNNGA